MATIKYIGLSILSLAFFAGCGGAASDQPELHSVSGKVTHAGKPLSDMHVVFTLSTGGRPASGQTDSDGNYSLNYKEGVAGAPAGTHIVRLGFVEAETEDYEAANNAEETEGEAALKGLPKSAFDGSLTKEVKAGSNEINIEL